MPNALKTPLYDTHVASGGRMVEFAGYEMPVQYSSVIAEAKAVRDFAGMFDVSHMARLVLDGENVEEFLETVTSNDVSKLTPFDGQYAVLCNPEGGCIDDIIVSKQDSRLFFMVVNASNHEKDVKWLHSQNKFGVRIKDQTDSTFMIAVQGPQAARLVANTSNDPENALKLPTFGFGFYKIEGVDVMISRTGYTGEDGFEVTGPAISASKIWQLFKSLGILECGLASRDTLRVEAGLPLYGHELGEERSPLEAGIGWAISKTKTFIGSQEIQSLRESGLKSKLIGIRFSTKRLALPGSKVFQEGSEVGEVVSGVYSPLLECGIATAFVVPECKFGQTCEVDLRGKLEPAEFTNKRFFVRAKPA